MNENEKDRVVLPPTVTMLGAFRATGEHEGRFYGPVGFVAKSADRRHAAIEQIVRQALGGVHNLTDAREEYALLECYDDSGDMICDFGIRDRRAFDFLYRKLGWRLERAEGVSA